MTPLKKAFALTTRAVNIAGYPVKALALRNSKRVRVLLSVNDSVLLVKSSVGSQRWSLPGGAIEKRETPLKAAVRETYEETGVLIAEEDLKKLGTIERSIKLTPFTFEITFFSVQLSRLQPAKVIRPLEVLEVQWFDMDNLPKNYSDTLDIALNLYNKH